jgi:hypothetical protein
MPRLKNMKKTETFTEQNSLYRCLFAAPSVRNRRGDKGVSYSAVSPPKNNASFNTLTLIALHDSMRWQDYLAVGRFPTIHKRPQQHWKNDMML